MPDFADRTEATVDAAPKMLFDIVSDLSTHVELAGERRTQDSHTETSR